MVMVVPDADRIAHGPGKLIRIGGLVKVRVSGLEPYGQSHPKTPAVRSP